MIRTPPWSDHRVIPLVVFDDLDSVIPLCELLRDTSIGIIEIALRSPVALDAILRATTVSGLVVGAGTLLTPADAEAARQAGAHFGVSPSATEQMLSWAGASGFPYLPGVATPTEAHRAYEHGFTSLKVYPANTLGGLEFVDSLRAVLPDVSVMPSGGVKEEIAREYLAHPGVFAVSGSWLTPRQMIASGDFDTIASLLSPWSTP